MSGIRQDWPRARAPLWRLRRAVRRLSREDGTATVEFVILFPLFMLALVNAIEASMLMARATMLDRALDLAVRELRVGTSNALDREGFRGLICSHAPHLPDCAGSLQVDLRVLAPGEVPASDAPARCEDAGSGYALGLGSQVMVVRACVIARPVIPNLGLAALLPSDAHGFHLVAISAFLREPSNEEDEA